MQVCVCFCALTISRSKFKIVSFEIVSLSPSFWRALVRRSVSFVPALLSLPRVNSSFQISTLIPNNTKSTYLDPHCWVLYQYITAKPQFAPLVFILFNSAHPIYPILFLLISSIDIFSFWLMHYVWRHTEIFVFV